MDVHTRSARQWLDRRYSRKEDGSYLAHQPVDGLATKHSEPNIILRLARTYHLLTLFEKLDFGSFLDVGGGEGYLSAVVRDLYGAVTCSTDLSTEACVRASELFGARSLATDAARLPFRDKSYDLVLCSEVIEHLSQPVWAIGELVRVARMYVVITTAECSPLGELERNLRLCLLDSSYPHAERNWFTPQDFQTLLGDDIVARSQMRNLGGRVSHFFADRNLTQNQAEIAINYLTASAELDFNHDGIIVLKVQPEFKSDVALANSALLSAQRRQQIFNRLLNWPTQAYQKLGNDFPVDNHLLETLQCLACGGTLAAGDNQLTCLRCLRTFLLTNGIPVFLLDEASADLPVYANPIEILSEGEISRAEAIRALVTKLHGQRPLTIDPMRRRGATLLLRLLYFLLRPESIGHKLRRLLGRLGKRGMVFDTNDIEQALLAA